MINMAKKINLYCNETRIDAAKTTSKRVLQKIAEATDLIGNKIDDKIASFGKSKEKEKQRKQKFTIH